MWSMDGGGGGAIGVGGEPPVGKGGGGGDEAGRLPAGHVARARVGGGAIAGVILRQVRLKREPAAVVIYGSKRPRGRGCRFASAIEDRVSRRKGLCFREWM